MNPTLETRELPWGHGQRAHIHINTSDIHFFRIHFLFIVFPYQKELLLHTRTLLIHPTSAYDILKIACKLDTGANVLLLTLYLGERERKGKVVGFGWGWGVHNDTRSWRPDKKADEWKRPIRWWAHHGTRTPATLRSHAMPAPPLHAKLGWTRQAPPSPSTNQQTHPHSNIQTNKQSKQVSAAPFALVDPLSFFTHGLPLQHLAAPQPTSCCVGPKHSWASERSM